MPRRVSIVVLCEDTQHEAFAAAYANRYRLPSRNIRYVRGGSKAGVRRELNKEAKAMLGAGGETHLIVLIDADGVAQEDNVSWLLDGLDADTRKRLVQSGRFLVLCPAWEIENWIAHLNGAGSSEEHDPRLGLRHPSDCREPARKLAAICRDRRALVDAPPSLSHACAAWDGYRSGLSGR